MIQITDFQKVDIRVGKIIAVEDFPKQKILNFPPRQIGPAKSEVLTLGVPDENNQCILVVPEKETPLGGKLY